MKITKEELKRSKYLAELLTQAFDMGYDKGFSAALEEIRKADFGFHGMRIHGKHFAKWLEQKIGNAKEPKHCEHSGAKLDWDAFD